MSAYVKIYCQKSKIRKDGTSPIYLIVKLRSKEAKISTRKYIEAKYFDNGSGVVKKGANNSTRLNTWLGAEKNKIEKIILDIENDGRPLSLELIKREYESGGGNDFISFCREEIENSKGVLASSTLKENGYCINNLESFAPGVTFDQIDYNFLQNYQYYMTNTLGKSRNGQFNDFKTIRKFFNVARKKGLTKSYPFNTFKFSDEEVEKGFLTIDELKELHRRVVAMEFPGRLFLTAGYFALCCFTGIRRSDMLKASKLKREEFIKTHMIDHELTIRMGKTNKYTRIPLSNKAWELIHILFEKPLKHSDSHCNEDLKEIMELMGIKKHITYHCSRHTFAIISLILGVRIEVVSNVLGHSSLKTTQIYAKIVDTFRRSQMDKWNEM
jgi:site-specific recombinase XerD